MSHAQAIELQHVPPACRWSEAPRFGTRRLGRVPLRAGNPQDRRLAQAGDIVGGYRLDASVGTGAGAQVFQATAPSGAQVAVKILSSNNVHGAGSVMRFHQEAAALDRIQHPNVVQRLQPVTSSCLGPFMVLRYIEGETLRHWLEHAPNALRQALPDLLRQLARALAAVHAAGVVHADIKPENILLERRNHRLHVVLVDFDAAWLWRDDRYVSALPRGAIAGTPAYMAPELAAGNPLDPRADVYGFGMVLRELLEQLDVHIPPLAAAASACLQDDPCHRPRGMAHVLAALDQRHVA